MSDPPNALRQLLADKAQRAILKLTFEDGTPATSPTQMNKSLRIDPGNSVLDPADDPT